MHIIKVGIRPLRFTNNDTCGSCVQVTISFEVEVLSFCTIAVLVITSQSALVKELRVSKVFLCEMIIHTITLQHAVVESNASARCAYDVTNECTALKLYMKNLASGKCLVPCVYYFFVEALTNFNFSQTIAKSFVLHYQNKSRLRQTVTHAYTSQHCDHGGFVTCLSKIDKFN